eukprot:09156.XXX_313559_313416_1 [CDS] Oithona nana genome sequencing.
MNVEHLMMKQNSNILTASKTFSKTSFSFRSDEIKTSTALSSS